MRWICQTKANLDTGDINTIISTSAPKIFDNYPIFDEAYRTTLNTKILRHYYTREIGEETVELWRFRLNTRMNEIMPYYNLLYKSATLNFNPLYDVDYSTSRSGTTDSTGDSMSSTNATETQTTAGSTSKVSATDSTDKASAHITRNRNEDESTLEAVKTNGISNQESLTKRSGESSTETNSNNQTTADSNGNSDSTVTKSQKDLYSDTPQGNIGNVEGGSYLTNARVISGTETNTNTNKQETASVNVTSAREGSSNNENTNVTNSETSANATSRDLNRGTSEISTEGQVTTNDSSGNATEQASTKTDSDRTNTGRTSEKTKSATTENYIERVAGKMGGASYAQMLKEYRETLLNIDMQIIEELNDLFFGLLA